MKRRLCLAVLCTLPASAGWALSERQQQLADRYFGLVEKNPAQDTAFQRLWALYAGAGKTDQLIERCRVAAQEVPEAAILWAKVLEKAGRPADAQAALEAALAAHPDSTALRLARADGLRRNGRPREAAEILAGIASAPDAGYWFQLGETWLEAGEPAEALAAWKNAAGLAPGDLALRQKLAVAAEQAGDLELAETHLLVIAENGEPARRLQAWETLSRFREKGGDFSGAAAAQEALIARMGDNHWQLREARQRLLSLHRKAGSLEKLSRRWEAEAAAAPENPSLALRQGELHRFREDWDARREWLRRASDLLPKNAALAREAALAELQVGGVDAAAQLVDRALTQEPYSADLVFLRAEIDALGGREKEAEERIEAFAASSPPEESIEIRAIEFYRTQRLLGPLEKRLAAHADAHPGDESAQTALAEFWIENGKPDAAAQRLVRFYQSLPPASTEAALRLADLLKKSGLSQPALEILQSAHTADPFHPETALALADLWIEKGGSAAALKILQRATEGETLPREDLDRKIFVLQQDTETDALASLIEAPLQSTLTQLRATAAQRSAPADWVRLARWLRWADDSAGSLDALRTGLSKHPGSLPLAEILAAQLSENGDIAGAIAVWSQLEKQSPEKSFDYRRRIGQLEMDRQNLDEALRIFDELAHQQPHDWKAAADLALAEQRAGNWYEALETWQAAHALAPADARRGLRQPILHAAVRLQQLDRALEFLIQTCQSEKDPAAQEDLLKEAAAFAVQNNATNAWKLLLEKQARAHPEQAAWALGKVFLLEAQGQSEEARQAFLAAKPEDQQSPADWEKSLRAAESAGDWTEAARICARLAEGDPAPAWAIRRAEALEKAGQIAEAKEAWSVLTRRFARSPDTLIQAADFFRRTGDETQRESLLRTAAMLGTPSPQVLLELGRIAMDHGNRTQALADWEQILKVTRPTPGSQNDLLPAPDRLHHDTTPTSRRPVIPLSGFLHASQPVPLPQPDESQPAGCRLLAIRAVATLLANSPRKSTWLSEFSGPEIPEAERIWALYYLGEYDLACAKAVRFLSDRPVSAALDQGFAAMALEAGQYDRLNHWASANRDDIARRWTAVVTTFRRMLANGWTPAPAALPEIFRLAPLPFRWQACHLLAHEGFPGEAAKLGATVIPGLPRTEQINASIEVAQWELARRDVDAAVRILDDALRTAPPAAALNSPYFAALRARWLLTPPEERSAFEESLRAQLADWNNTAGRAGAGLLLSALNQQRNPELVRRYLEAGGPPDQEPWKLTVLQSAKHLEGWGLKRTARDLYRQLLEDDLALDLLQTGWDFRQATETQLMVSLLSAASSPNRRAYLLNEWLARGVTDTELLNTAVQALQTGQPELAAELFQVVRTLSEDHDTVLPNLLALGRQPGLKPAVLPVICRWMEGSDSPAQRANLQAAGFWLAGEYEAEGDPEAGLALIENLRQAEPFNRPLLLQHAHLLSRLGRHRDALRELEAAQAAGPELALLRAELLAGLGREKEALDVLESEARVATPSQTQAVQKWRALARQLNDTSAQAAAESLMLTRAPLEMLTTFAREAQSPADWQNLRRRINAQNLSPEDRFQFAETVLSQGKPPPDFEQEELAALTQLSRQDPNRKPRLYLVRKALAERKGTLADFEKELWAEWNNGWGEYFAGEILLQLAITQQRTDTLQILLDAYLTPRHFHRAGWRELGHALLTAGQPAAAERVLSALARRQAGTHEDALLLAQAQWKNGHQVGARAVLDTLTRIAELDPQRHFELARFYLAIGDLNAAKRHMEGAAQNPRLPDLRASYAAACFQAGRPDEARAVLQTLPPEQIPPPLQVEWLRAENRLNSEDVSPYPPGAPRQEFHLLMAQTLASSDPVRAVRWLNRETLADARAAELLRTLENSAPAEVVQLWTDAGRESPFWTVRTEAAAFFLRLAEKGGYEALTPVECLERAHALHPGSFAIARAYAESLTAAGRPDAARQVLQECLAAFGSPVDHRRAAQLLARLQASPALPRGGE